MLTKLRVVKYIDATIEIGIYLLAFLVPLYFSFIYRDFSVFSLDKTILFRVLTEILVLLMIARMTISGQVFIYIRKKALLLVLPFFIALTAATILSADPAQSFWGSYWRQQGLFTYLHYLLFFFVLTVHIFTYEKIENIINVALFGSFFVCIYGVIQWLGLDVLPWYGKAPVFTRVTSTLGQPVFLGNYITLVIFLTVYKLAVMRKRGQAALLQGRKYRFVWRFTALLFLLLLQFLCLVFTYSRGAWLGFIFGIFFAVLMYIYTKGQGRKIIAIALIFIILLSGVLFIVRLIPRESINNYYVRVYVVWRLQEITDLKSASMTMRLMYWLAGIDAISQRPVFGYGPENHKTVLTGYYDLVWSVYESLNISTDRVHNELLDIMIAGGAVTGAAYLLILFSVLSAGLGYVKKMNSKHRSLVFFLLTGFFAYQFSLLTSFSVTETSVYFWLYLVFLLILLNGFEKNILFDMSGVKKVYLLPMFGGALLLAACAGYMIIVNINILAADHYFREARISFDQKNYIDMFDNYEKATELNNKEEYYKIYLVHDALLSLDEINSSDYRQSVFDYLQYNVISGLEHKNRTYTRTMLRAEYLTMLGKYDDKLYFEQAETEFRNAVGFNSFLPNTYKSWAGMYMRAGDYRKAIVMYKTTLSVLPDPGDPRLNIPHRREINDFLLLVYRDMAECYVKLSDFHNSLDLYHKMLTINPFLLDIYREIADLYYKQGDKNQAIWYNKRAYMMNPDNYIWPYSIAILYHEQGDGSQALEFAEDAMSLNPENKEVKRMINALKYDKNKIDREGK